MDPLGEVATQAGGLASRTRDLRGKTLGIIDNGMPGSNDILSALAELLRERAGVREVIVRQKANVSHPAAPDIVAELAKHAHFAICGVGV
jgi:hypothetical protein